MTSTEVDQGIIKRPQEMPSQDEERHKQADEGRQRYKETTGRPKKPQESDKRL